MLNMYFKDQTVSITLGLEKPTLLLPHLACSCQHFKLVKHNKAVKTYAHLHINYAFVHEIIKNFVCLLDKTNDTVVIKHRYSNICRCT